MEGKNSNVIDFFSRRNMSEMVQAPSKASDDVVNKLGRYLGVLRAEDGEYARHMTTQLAQKRAQIDALIEQWQYLYNDYAVFMSDMLVFLNVREGVINPTDDEIYVDSAGHVWAIRESDKDAFLKAMKGEDKSGTT